MRTVLPGRPSQKLQAIGTALWEGIRVVVYISGHAVVILNGAHSLLQTIYVDDVPILSAVAIDEAFGRIAVCGGTTVLVYQPSRVGSGIQWDLAHRFRYNDNDDDDGEPDDPITTLSWGGADELLIGNGSLTLWLLADSPRVIWKNKIGNSVKLSQFSYDAGFIATTGDYDRLVKIWKRRSFGLDEARFDVTYLPHPKAVTGIHWRRPYHRDQTIDNVLYTICADNKIRIWSSTKRHALSALQLWNEIDMMASIQPRHPSQNQRANLRYGFIIDSRDFSTATERAVQHGPTTDKDQHALEHVIEVATKCPDLCVVLDGMGHMCVWGLENPGCKSHDSGIFNIAHVEGVNLSFALDGDSLDDYAQFHPFAGGVTDASFTILAHYFDGRIEWLDSKVDVLLDPAPRRRRLTTLAVWSGHGGPIKKIVRTPSGNVLSSRTDDNKAVIWRQRPGSTGAVLVQQSTLRCDMHIHRTCLIEDGNFLVNLHHNGISLWDIRPSHAQILATCEYHLGTKPLCVLLIPTSEATNVTYVAAIGADMTGIAWELELPTGSASGKRSNGTNPCLLREFCTFSLGKNEDVKYILPVDPAGEPLRASDFLDLFATDIALSYSHDGTIKTWTAKVDPTNRKIDWLLTATVETSIADPSLASAGSVRKAALVDQSRTSLTIWDTNSAQLEFEERFPEYDVISDLDWTSTPDTQSILAVGFPHKIVLLSQLRYDYVDAGPSWAQIREIQTQHYTPHPIGDSCWLGNGNLVVGTGNQLFVYDKYIEASNRWVTSLRLPYRKEARFNLFEVVSRLNGPLPVFHPQFLAQCILSGKTRLVHLILIKLYRKLKFATDADGIDGFLDIPLEDIYTETPPMQHIALKEMKSSYADFTLDEEPIVVDETIAGSLNEYLTKIALPQLSSKEQFHLVNTIECVATVEKHRRSMDDNAARYFLFFRQHLLRRSQGISDEFMLPWREIVWAFHSDSHEILADLVSKQYDNRMLWENARESGIFMWLTDANAVRIQLETIARNEYTKKEEKNPIDCSIFYLALKKKNVLQGLWRMAGWHREQASTQRFLSNNFKEPRWQTAALKNAFALLGKRRFEYAAAFFLLADRLRDAVNVCLNQLQDLQLAIMITRAYEGDNGPVLKEILEERVLTTAAIEGNRWMATWAFWMLNRRDNAVRALVSPVESLLPPTPRSPASPGQIALQAKSYLSNDPALVVLYKQLREKTLQTLRGAASIPPRAEWDFVLRNARLYGRMGCDSLALNLVREWEFLSPPLSASKGSLQMPANYTEDAPDLRKLLKRRSSLVVADMHDLPQAIQELRKNESAKGPPPQHSNGPPVYQEPDPNSLLDAFGF
ncbi:regulator of (H+)-ATPase in vacuolar membrane [Myotisia sp. PD_48]|nr:regulator of (H+)-ATPase in vacuolar membrane [Myotisia sp. PD_48]